MYHVKRGFHFIQFLLLFLKIVHITQAKYLFLFYLFIHIFWLYWLIIAAVGGGHPLVVLLGPLSAVASLGGVHPLECRLSGLRASVVVMQGLSCSKVHGLFLDQGSSSVPCIPR